MPEWRQTKSRANFEKTRNSNKSSINFLSVQRDIDALIITAIKNSDGDIDKFLEYFKDLKELKQINDTLTKNRDELEVLFDDMKMEFGKKQFTGPELENETTTALFGLIQEIANKTTDRKDIGKNLAIGLQENNQYNSLVGINQYKSMISFMEKYYDLKQSFFTASSKFNERTEMIRGDKQYYGIFLEAAKDKKGNLLDKTQTDRFMVLSRQQFEQFEQLNPDLFGIEISQRYQKRSGNISKSEGTVQKFGLKSGITSQDVYKKMISTFGENGVTDILDQIYTTTNEGKALSYREVFTQLSQSNNENLQGVKTARRLEMMFDPNFRENLKQGQDVNLAAQVLNKNDYKENVYGAATGDVNFKTQQGNVVALQLKYKGADFLPWNNQGFQGMIDGFNTFIAMGQMFTNGDNGRQRVAELLGSDEEASKIAEQLGEDPRFYEAIESVIGEFTVDEFDGGGFDVGWDEE